jgi:hypothetical protein
VIIGRDSGANVSVNTNGNVTIRADIGTEYTWTFAPDGSLTIPGGGVIYTDDGGINIGGYQSSFTDQVINLITNSGVNEYIWVLDNTGTLTYPAINNTQQQQQGTTTQVAGDPFPAELSFNSVDVIWTASSDDVIGADLLIRAQGNGDGGSATVTVTEVARVSLVKDAYDLAAQPTATVYGQVSSNSAINFTTYDAGLDGSNRMTVLGNTIPHGSNRYFSYSVTEFKKTYNP